jgi:hypothetical protein
VLHSTANLGTFICLRGDPAVSGERIPTSAETAPQAEYFRKLRRVSIALDLLLIISSFISRYFFKDITMLKNF